MTDVIMIREIIKIGIDQTAEIEKFHLVAEYSMYKNIQTDQGITEKNMFNNNNYIQ